jgi:hypothetical protein
MRETVSTHMPFFSLWFRHSIKLVSHTSLVQKNSAFNGN